MVGEVAGEKVVGAPPEEEEGAKEKSCRKTVVDAPDSVGSSLGWCVSASLVNNRVLAQG